MKILFLMLLMLTFFSTTAQKSVVGEYHDYFGHRLKLYADFTFECTWRFDLGSSWTQGKWHSRNDTVYLDAIPVYDTMKYHDVARNIYMDSLVLSMDRKSELITSDMFVGSLLAGGGQNRKKVPDKLYYRNRKLFHIDQDGRIIRKRQNGIMRNKKHPPYFNKE